MTYKLPRSFERSATLLRDDAGKIRRSQVQQRAIAAHDGAAAAGSARSMSIGAYPVRAAAWQRTTVSC